MLTWWVTPSAGPWEGEFVLYAQSNLETLHARFAYRSDLMPTAASLERAHARRAFQQQGWAQMWVEAGVEAVEAA